MKKRTKTRANRHSNNPRSAIQAALKRGCLGSAKKVKKLPDSGHRGQVGRGGFRVLGL